MREQNHIRIFALSVSNITKRSMPMPSPAVGASRIQGANVIRVVVHGFLIARFFLTHLLRNVRLIFGIV